MFLIAWKAILGSRDCTKRSNIQDVLQRFYLKTTSSRQSATKNLIWRWPEIWKISERQEFCNSVMLSNLNRILRIAITVALHCNTAQQRNMPHCTVRHRNRVSFWFARRRFGPISQCLNTFDRWRLEIRTFLKSPTSLQTPSLGLWAVKLMTLSNLFTTKVATIIWGKTKWVENILLICYVDSNSINSVVKKCICAPL